MMAVKNACDRIEMQLKMLRKNELFKIEKIKINFEINENGIWL